MVEEKAGQGQERGGYWEQWQCGRAELLSPSSWWPDRNEREARVAKPDRLSDC